MSADGRGLGPGPTVEAVVDPSLPAPGPKGPVHEPRATPGMDLSAIRDPSGRRTEGETGSAQRRRPGVERPPAASPSHAPRAGNGTGLETAIDPEGRPAADAAPLAGSVPTSAGGGLVSTPAASPATVPAPAALTHATLAPLVVEIAERHGAGSVELALAPEELGWVRLHLQTRGDHVHVTLSVERPDTADLLRRSIDQFASDLRDAGYAHASFGFSGWGERPPERDEPPHRPAPYAEDRAPRQTFQRSEAVARGGLDLRL